MFRRRSGGAACALAVAVAVAGLAACGGGASGEAGVLLGSVQGVRYQTPSHSGLTGPRGEFRYEPGETVAFYLGGTALGAVPGAARVTPLDLAATALPTAEAATCDALLRLDEPSDLGRAFNLALLFLALDRDADPANGLDLSGADAALTGVVLRPDAPPFVFLRRDAQVLGSSERRFLLPVVQDAVLWLYEATGQQVPAHLQTGSSYAEPPTAPRQRVVQTSHDATGQVVLVRSDWDGDGLFEGETEYLPDAQGRYATSVQRTSAADDGAWTSGNLTARTYDAGGRLLTITSRDEAPIGTVVRQTTSLYGYDAAGRFVSSRTERDPDGDGPLAATITSSTSAYDAAGLRSTQEGDWGTGHQWSTYHHDAAGRFAGYDQALDTDGDGVADQWQSLDITFDAEGNAVAQHVASLAGPSGPATALGTVRSTYDAQGRLVSSVEERDDDADGLADRTLRTTRTRDAGGRETEYTFEASSGDPAVVTSRYGTTSAYDAAGRLTASSTSTDPDGDGPQGATLERTTYLFDASGRAIGKLQEADQDGDGVIDRHWRIDWTLDAAGQRVAEDGAVDLDDDGVLETTWRSEYAWAPVADGLRYLLQTCRSGTVLAARPR